jgi:3-deoxy-manno-octulosonate cytidylyltransferase (CMP-KDO synthetase)
MQVLAVIPARYGSTRFPGKPLVQLGGKTIIQRVWERARAMDCLDQVVIATDDQRIYDHAQEVGAEVQMTADTHRSGTDRIAEVAQDWPDYELVINIQGDEPFVREDQVEALVRVLQRTDAEIATLARQLAQEEDLFNPNVVKVVFNRRNEAMYFSRSTIPYIRDLDKKEWFAEQCFYQHLGMYAFRRDVLLEVTALLPSRYEQLESLEQLRWLDYGKRIQVALTDQPGIGIDTPADLERAEAYLKEHGTS